MTFTEALNRVLHLVENDPASAALLAVTLTRLAVISANQPDSQAKLDLFELEFRLERGRLRLLAAIPLARRIDGGNNVHKLS